MEGFPAKADAFSLNRDKNTVLPNPARSRWSRISTPEHTVL
ncbi:hypothetical protein SOVF_142950 isoform A [Spinacia oleracea]|nr:hypothetical protein SOVF_142950 isoform A [Spinacia oleracea]